MSKSSAGQWVKFFNASGIPSPAAATYAHIFVENRIQTDMLMDLNKEYLREMGISPMGDIIAILRHAKHVNDQTAREKVLSFESVVPIAAVSPAKPMLPEKRTTAPIKLKQTVTPSVASIVPKQPRRVLPEHEGKYKIKLPSGTTKRSKEIMDKRYAKLYSDRESGKSCVFQRLKNHSTKMSGESDSSSSVEMAHDNVVTSIFARLGGKADGVLTKEIKPILKKTPESYPSRIVKAKNIPLPVKQQKVILVKKVPLKGSSDDDSWEDENEDDMDCDYSGGSEKIVKFASTAEVREIASVVHRTNNGKWRNRGATDVVRARLGSSKTMHHTKKIINFKPKNAAAKPNISRMKSELLDRQDLPVHKRLGGKDVRALSTTASSTVSSLSKRIGKISLKRPQPTRTTSYTHTKSQGGGSRGPSSVFDRLGFGN